MAACPNCGVDNPATAPSCSQCGAMLGRQAIPWGWAVLTAFLYWITQIPFLIIEEKTGIPAIILDPLVIAFLMGYAAGVRPIRWLAPLTWSVMVAVLVAWTVLTDERNRPGYIRQADKLVAATALAIAIGAAASAVGAACGYALDRARHRRSRT